MPSPPVAYLGPAGTYSHQAVLDRFGRHAAELVPCRTIADVFHYAPADRSTGHYALLPFENSKNGIVLETLDLLLAAPPAAAAAASSSSSASAADESTRAWRIVQELRVRVRHCLIVREDFKGRLDELEWVKSHEQALAQCQRFLTSALPQAKRIPVPSTAGAAASLREPGADRGAAVCARGVVEVIQGLRVEREGVEDMTGNTTRFLLLYTPPPPPSSAPSSSRATAPPPSPSAPALSAAAAGTPPSPPQIHLYAYRPPRPSCPCFAPPRALTARSRRAPVLRAVDRRPAGDGGDVYLVAFEVLPGGEGPEEEGEGPVRGLEEEEEEKDGWRWIGGWDAFDGGGGEGEEGGVDGQDTTDGCA